MLDVLAFGVLVKGQTKQERGNISVQNAPGNHVPRAVERRKAQKTQ